MMDEQKILKKLHQNLDWSLRGACDNNPQAAVALKLISDSILSVMKECEMEKTVTELNVSGMPVPKIYSTPPEVDNQQIVFIERRRIAGTRDYEEVFSTIGQCPSCEETLKRTDHKNYCGNCGQAIRWTRY